MKLIAGEQWRTLIATGVFATPRDIVGVVIGAGGARVGELERASGAVISIDRASPTFTIRGSPAATARAVAALNALVVPAATIEVAEQWSRLIEGDEAVYASAMALTKVLHGIGGERIAAIQRTTGTAIWAPPDGSRLFISGDAAAVAAARAALDASVSPTATIDAAARWGALVAEGAHASLNALMKQLHGLAALRLRAVKRSCGVAIWQSPDGARLFLSGEPAAVARAHAALDALVVPAETIYVAARWGKLVEDGVYDSIEDLVRVLHGAGAARLHAIERASGVTIWASRDYSRLFIAGDVASIACARALIYAIVVPACSIDVPPPPADAAAAGERAGSGAAAQATRARESSGGTDACIWTSGNVARVFVSGADPAAVARAYAAVRAGKLTPAVRRVRGVPPPTPLYSTA